MSYKAACREAARLMGDCDMADDGRELVFTGIHDNKLVAGSWGDPANPPVIFLHGGGQTRHAWGGTAQQIAAAGESVAELATSFSGSDDDPDYKPHLARTLTERALLGTIENGRAA